MKYKILKAAIELFNTKGYRATTMKDIVKKAGTSIGNCYFYFKNKEALLFEAMNMFSKESEEKIANYLKNYQKLIDKIAVSIYLETSINYYKNDIKKLLMVGLNIPAIKKKVVDDFLNFAVNNILTGDYDELCSEQVLAESVQKKIENKHFEWVILSYFHASMALIESIHNNDIDVEFHEMALFIVEYHLLAFGFPKSEVEKSLLTTDKLKDSSIIKDLI